MLTPIIHTLDPHIQTKYFQQQNALEQRIEELVRHHNELTQGRALARHDLSAAIHGGAALVSNRKRANIPTNRLRLLLEGKNPEERSRILRRID